MKHKFLSILFVVIIANILYFGMIRGRFAPANPFDETTFMDDKQQNFSIQDFDDKVVLVSFFQTWCVDCRKELLELEALQNKFPKELKVLIISDEPFEKLNSAKSFLNSQLSFYTCNQSLKSIGIYRFPTTYLINKSGKIVKSEVERIHWNTIEIQKLITSLSN
ncbi:MAG TPA: TlpA disulfide reductase family protein [Chitinophagales bacterium]|jgi:thiol-disulfide isomerase/thioredoxin|nr:TlpA family protein disulfide reductase [Chitinophagales bacterium]MBP6154016.1 TlpA family protein disulfide reductase [Chitinophagales bacterium]HQV79299.1 TlpA disulfide reductase family protein [Chitinophagales bacterium]HQW80191.1 TlpA disulfide reductase family protein [Chitinophagales bacterium]HRB68149.1 TlpA disulfide reductase family protein [Chitinophagales bacterium]